MQFLVPSRQSLIPNLKSQIPIRAANALLAATLAPDCAVCGALLDQPCAGCVCRTCWGAIRPITPPVCDVCGDPLARDIGRCSVCQTTERRGVARSRAIGEYDGTLRAIVHALKYDGRLSLARPLAALMRSRGAELIEQADCVVPVPLHWRREHSRGFNQARELARHLGLPVVDGLIRRRHTRPQVELAAHCRRANVADAFRMRRGWLRRPDVRRLNVLLIDDVSTTGATLDSCAWVLKEAGAAEVYALVTARVSAGRASRSSRQTLRPR